MCLEQLHKFFYNFFNSARKLTSLSTVQVYLRLMMGDMKQLKKVNYQNFLK